MSSETFIFEIMIKKITILLFSMLLKQWRLYNQNLNRWKWQIVNDVNVLLVFRWDWTTTQGRTAGVVFYLGSHDSEHALAHTLSHPSGGINTFFFFTCVHMLFIPSCHNNNMVSFDWYVLNSSKHFISEIFWCVSFLYHVGVTWLQYFRWQSLTL